MNKDDVFYTTDNCPERLREWDPAVRHALDGEPSPLPAKITLYKYVRDDMAGTLEAEDIVEFALEILDHECGDPEGDPEGVEIEETHEKVEK